ncbi:MAG: HNH endonuclease [Candidatus Neomarinimicrobiota bacterium]
MAITHGHGNPNWTKDETILALDLYFDFQGHIPSSNDNRIIALSELLRTFPYHSLAIRRESFRNADGVVFKLQNLRQVATGKGLGNVSKMDRAVWREYGNNPVRVKEIANLIRTGIKIIEGREEETGQQETFIEGKIVTEIHLTRERNPRIRKRLLNRRWESGVLKCDMCGCSSLSPVAELGDAMFEAHHVLPLSAAADRKTRLKDMALLCANCHRMVHRAITCEKRWLTLEEAKVIIAGDNN